MTSVPGVFAAGDVVTGSKTVVHAVAAAKQVAGAMARSMDEHVPAVLPDVTQAATPGGRVHHVHGTMDV